MAECKITIIIPVYKVEKYLRRCLDSVLGQTVSCWEAVLVDDGSPDASAAICDEYAARDSRFHVIHRENGGLSAARNTGIEWMLKHSESTYVTFLDSDDWLHPRFLEILVGSVEATGADVGMGGIANTDAYTGTFRSFSPLCQPEVYSGEELFLARKWDFNYACGKLFSKEHFRALRFPEGKIFEDVFTTYRVLFAAEKIALVDAPLYCYFYNREGISHSPWKEAELVIFEGMQEQLSFYEANGFPRAYEKEHRLYLNHFAYQITRIRENKADYPKNKHHIPRLRREMLAIIRQSKGKYNCHNMPQCYEAAYPALWKCAAMASGAVRTMKEEGIAGLFCKVRTRLTGK